MASSESKVIFFLGQKVTAMRNRATRLVEQSKEQADETARLALLSRANECIHTANEVETWVTEIRTGGLK